MNHIGSNGFSEHSDARINVAGFVPASEGTAVMHGLVGAKGGFLDGVDLNDVVQGGIYMLPPMDKVTNGPFLVTQVSQWSHVIVLRNFGSNADAGDDEVNIFQILITHQPSPKFAIRTKFGTTWNPWKYLSPLRLWIGNVTGQTETEIPLSQSYLDFDILRFEYRGLRTAGSHFVDVPLYAKPTEFSLRSFNLPNSVNTNPAIEFGELNITVKDNKTLTLKESVANLANGGTIRQDMPLGGMALKSVWGIHQ
ncbi:pyocin knob domain-containing protein [Enterococcus sp. AZ196]|uniref:pyocin knob domain-containing protein n=1 Tax=Enterococcus sp. AZ196 TaxID=2774659 RepID=UPI003D2C4AFF